MCSFRLRNGGRRRLHAGYGKGHIHRSYLSEGRVKRGGDLEGERSFYIGIAEDGDVHGGAALTFADGSGGGNAGDGTGSAGSREHEADGCVGDGRIVHGDGGLWSDSLSRSARDRDGGDASDDIVGVDDHGERRIVRGDGNERQSGCNIEPSFEVAGLFIIAGGQLQIDARGGSVGAKGGLTVTLAVEEELTRTAAGEDGAARHAETHASKPSDGRAEGEQLVEIKDGDALRVTGFQIGQLPEDGVALYGDERIDDGDAAQDGGGNAFEDGSLEGGGEVIICICRRSRGFEGDDEVCPVDRA